MGTIFRPKNCTYFVKRLKMAIFVEGFLVFLALPETWSKCALGIASLHFSLFQ